MDIGPAPTVAERRPIAGRGGANFYRCGSQGTARGSRVQNREMEDGGYEDIGSSHISIDKHPVWMYYLIEIRQNTKMPKIN